MSTWAYVLAVLAVNGGGVYIWWLHRQLTQTEQRLHTMRARAKAATENRHAWEDHATWLETELATARQWIRDARNDALAARQAAKSQRRDFLEYTASNDMTGLAALLDPTPPELPEQAFTTTPMLALTTGEHTT